MGLLDGKVAVITGAAGGQGRVACLAFAREGARVVACDLDAAANEETVVAVRTAGGDIAGFGPVDLTDRAAVEGFVAAAAARYGGLDIVYNNAGGPRFGPIAEMSIEDWRLTIAVELDSVFLVTRYAWPHLVSRGAGVILNVSSVGGMIGFPEPPMAAHVAAKAGVIGLTRQLAVEGAPHGIRAVSISPGAILSRQGDLDPGAQAAVTGRTLLKRWGRPEEVVEAAVFLASDRASYITGVNLPIEGGVTAW